jgi:hypothetical protein
MRASSLPAGPSAAATAAPGAASGQDEAGSASEAKLGPTAGGAAAALDAAEAQLSGAWAATERMLPMHVAHGDGGPVPT